MKKIVIFSILTIVLSYSCVEKPTPPIITTTIVSAISFTSATSGGNLSSEGGDPVISRGTCWSTSAEPSTVNDKTSEGDGPGTFTSNLTNLIPNTLYYIKAYATNSVGTGYGNQLTFTTKQLEVPALSTATVTEITKTTAVSGGNISAENGSSITTRGVCWSVTTNPTTSDSKTSDGNSVGIFTSSVTGLLPGTKYYLRAYSTNSVGTAYGNEVSFNTNADLPVLTTKIISDITNVSAAGGGTIISDGGAAVTVRGVCWSTSQNPDIRGYKTTDASGSGLFLSSITGLRGNITYYVRAYATNNVGTSYGNEISFTTLPPASPVLTTAPATSVTTTAATGGGSVINDGGADLIARGVCWSTSQNPVITNFKTIAILTGESFTNSITGLTPNTTYYLRSYGTNSAGTGYGSEVMFKTFEVLDIDGNGYYSVVIGTQKWLTENLKTKKYNNGDLIGTTNPASLDVSGEIAPKYQWSYSGNENYVATYGRLYSWFAVIDSRNVCPANWHAASDGDWSTMEAWLNANGYNYDGTVTYSIYNKIAKSLSSATLWTGNGNTGAVGNTDFPSYRNKSGFSAIPSGARSENGTFFDLGTGSYWWVSTQSDANFGLTRNIYNANFHVNRIGNLKNGPAFSVRCIKD